MKKLLLLLTRLLWSPQIAQKNEAEEQGAYEATPASKAEIKRGVVAYFADDYKTALVILEPLAEQGYADAQTIFGAMYNNGLGVSQNYGEAIKWYRKAAVQGQVGAQYNLGAVYHKGQGVEVDYGEAFKWYRKAATQGHADAQCNLGVMYALGQGVTKNNIYSYMWLSLAKANGDEKGQKLIESLIKAMSDKDITKAQDLAKKCLDSNYQDCPE